MALFLCPPSLLPEMLSELFPPVPKGKEKRFR
jgi:hypothetical protein